MERLSFVCWKWGTTFEPRHVNTLRWMLDLHVHMDHTLTCVTDDARGLDGDVRVVPMPETYAHTPRCRRRMQQYSRAFGAQLGARILGIDLDVVLVDDITPIVNRPEPIVGWKVGHAGVYSGSFILFDVGALDKAWQWFAADPEGFPRRIQPRGVPSDQAMINNYLAKRRRTPIPCWTEADGFVTYYGAGYEDREHLGVGPTRRALPAGARIVVLGSADKAVLDDPSYPWIAAHYIRASEAVSQ